MESCYKLYTWINHTMLMLILQIVWKIRQISDYFNDQSTDDTRPITFMEISPLNFEYKKRRHIRSMSDVQSGTPYNMPTRFYRKSSYNTLMYNTEHRLRRLRNHYRCRYYPSSDSSDYPEPIKQRSIEKKMVKPTDSMRFL